jgi:AcrR family transcriptional regulator
MPRRIDVDRLFDATLAVFAERGYAGTTTREIAERAGVNEVTIFRRHSSKAALVNAALARALAATPFAGLEVSQDVTVDLLALVAAFAATTRALGGAVMTLLVDAARHPELREAMALLLVNLDGATRVLQAHQDRDTLRKEDPRQQLTFLIAPVLAAGLWTRSRVGAPMQVDPETAVAGFLDGHRA